MTVSAGVAAEDAAQLDVTADPVAPDLPLPFNVTLSLAPVLGGAGMGASVAAGVQFTPLSSIAGTQGRHGVFLGHDHQLGTNLAYKVVPKDSLDLQEYFAEARRLHASRHRHVVPVQYACENSTYLFIAMPYYVNGSLQTLLEARMLMVREIIRLGLDVLMGLHHAHVRNVLHFDIKPSNIFLDESGAALLADFGQSCAADAQGAAIAPSMYEPHFPPEIETGTKLTRQADVYQAGLTLYRMCVGDREWRRQLAALGGTNTSRFADALRAGTFPMRDAFPEHIPKTLRKVVRKALMVDPDKRWPSALSLMTALAGIDELFLDWRASELPTGGMEWGLDEPPRRLRLDHDGSGKWQVGCWRLGEKTQQIKKATLGPSSEGPARDHAYKVLHGKLPATDTSKRG